MQTIKQLVVLIKDKNLRNYGKIELSNNWI